MPPRPSGPGALDKTPPSRHARQPSVTGPRMLPDCPAGRTVFLCGVQPAVFSTISAFCHPSLTKHVYL